jgi:uncharacterized protein involved in exopolysaccharide biosynthesis
MNQQPQSVPPYPVERGDELSLIELWKILVNYKLYIVGLTVLTTLVAIYYASNLPTIYKAEVLMIPASSGSGGSSSSLGSLANLTGIAIGGSNNTGAEGERALARLKTRSFLINHIKEKNLKPILFADQWNKETKLWIDQEPPDRDSAELLNSMIQTNSNPKSRIGITSLFVNWKNPSNPNKIADIANGLVSSLNSKAKQYAVLEAKNSILFLEKELEKTNILNSQTILYNLIEQQIGKIMMANVKDEFVFKVIDPAVIPKQAKNKPKIMIVFIGIVLGIFLGSFFAVSINYFKRQSAEASSI